MTVALPTSQEMTRQLRLALADFASVEWLAQTDSTNAQLLARAKQAACAVPCLLGAHVQRAGRGRGGRTWANRAGATLMFSCAFAVDVPARRLPALSVLAGVAVCTRLRAWMDTQTQAHLCLKWPNDVLWRGGKLAGLLLESARSADGKTIVVMGLGLNLKDAAALGQTLQRPVADWQGVLQDNARLAPVTAVQIVAGIAQSWHAVVKAAEQSEPTTRQTTTRQLTTQQTPSPLTTLPARFAAVDALFGQAVNVLDQGRVIQSGVVGGVDEDGRLLLRPLSGSGSVLPVSVGEISVRVQAR